MGGHAGGFVGYQKMPVLPDDGERPVAGNNFHFGAAVVTGLHRQNITGTKNESSSCVLPVDLNSVFNTGQTEMAWEEKWSPARRIWRTVEPSSSGEMIFVMVSMVHSSLSVFRIA